MSTANQPWTPAATPSLGGPKSEPAAEAATQPFADPAESLVAELLATRPVIDGHNDLPWQARLLTEGDWDRLDVTVTRTDTQTDLPRLRAGGVGGQFWSVYVPGTITGPDAFVQTCAQIDTTRRLIAAHPDDLSLVTHPAELAPTIASGRIASMLGAEGGHCIGESLAGLRTLHQLGVRYLTLTHNHNIPWADAATDRPTLGGLSRFGEHVVAEMNRLGMLVDLSHVSPDTMRHALDVTRAPTIFSHSSARAVCDVPRNVPDDVLVQLRRNGGVCMVTFVADFVSPAAAQWSSDAIAAATAAGVDRRDLDAMYAYTLAHAAPRPAATIDDVVAHIEHVVDIAGIEHVGLGGDYDGTDGLPEGLRDVSGYPRLLAALARRGWSAVELAALAGDNLERVWRQAQAVADASTHLPPDLTAIDDAD